MTFGLFVWLMIFAHFIGDYVLKTEWLSVTKGKFWYNMLVHCILYTGSVGWVLMKWTGYNGFPYVGMMMLFVSHWIIDTWKYNSLKGNSIEDVHSERGALYLDQISHFMVLAAVIVWYK